jgi:hypothetical protein
MDHVEFPPNNHVMDYSLPRVCHVKCSDFEFAVVNDLDRLSLNNKKVFGRRPVRFFTTMQHIFSCLFFAVLLLLSSSTYE